jgi:hypothetical protein
MRFVVEWRVEYLDAEAIYRTKLFYDEEGINNLEDILNFLSEGLENDKFQPELKTPFHEGDLQIDYVVIYKGDRVNIGKELLRDTDYDD